MFWRLQQCRKPQRLAGRRELVTLSFRDKLHDGCMQHGSFAANGCSTKETEHGERVDGRRFFGGEDEKDCVTSTRHEHTEAQMETHTRT